MLILQKRNAFWEVIEEESQQIRYTCLKEEDALDFQTRHANDPPPDPRVAPVLKNTEFNTYLRRFDRTHYQVNYFAAGGTTVRIARPDGAGECWQYHEGTDRWRRKEG